MSGGFPCVFCEIVACRAPALIVQETARSVAFVPLGPVTPGHVLFVPRVHVVDASHDPWVTGEVVADASVYAGRQGRPFNLITSSGRVATQSIFHLHVHYVPRAVDDQLMVPWGTLHGENPRDPHRCRGMIALEDKLEAVNR